MKPIKAIGLAIFLFSMALFIAIGLFSRYEVNEKSLNDFIQNLGEDQQAPVREAFGIQGDSQNKFAFYSRLKDIHHQANEAIRQEKGLSFEQIDEAAAAIQALDINETNYNAAIAKLPEAIRQTVTDWTSWLKGKAYESQSAAQAAMRAEFKKAGDNYASKYQLGDLKAFRFKAAKAFGTGWFWNNKGLIAILTLLLGSLGALMYIVPAFFDGMPGIKHNGIYFSSATNRGLIGIIVGVFLVGFYILLYFYHDWIAEWISLTDPVAQLLRGEDASQWFMYGLLYTIAIAVMGVRMFAKYRHSNYHKVRTASIIFFQVAFAFLIPQILYTLNLPDSDLKNAWPLNYYFFFDWNISKHIDAGTIGIFMLVWGIVLSAILVPLLTYFFGKRWYCSWVCGCGGLAETLGDPYRQLSDKSLKAWRVERWLIHGVLVFAVVMTGLVLYTYFSGNSTILGMNSFTIREYYGFAIGSIFAGVIGTGFYPLMGNRVWCRFGCPLAAYMGLVQRFRSRFRITTNGGQCISCGNCSTYCEMGIDVRWYAQRGQNIVRSSCVGCGVCAAVCPRGVLALENGPAENEARIGKAEY